MMNTPSDANPSPAVTQTGDVTALLHDLFAFVAAVQREPAALRRDGTLTRGAMLHLNEALLIREELAHARGESQASRLAFLSFLARTMDLVREQDRRLITPAGAWRWLSLPTTQQATALWAGWRDATDWDDVQRIPSLRVEPSAHARHDPAAVRQRALAALIPVLSPNAWVSLSDAALAIRERDPAFLRPHDPEHSVRWEIVDAVTGRDLAPARYWDLVEGALLRYLLTGPLHWLGLISLGYDAAGTLNHCALTLMGAHLWAHAPWSPPAREPLVIQPNFEVVASFHADPGAMLRLEHVADLVQAGPARVYRFTQDRFRAALDAGADPDAILAFLEQASAGSLPQNVAYTLREWAGQHGRVRLEPVTLLRTDDAVLMQELRAARRIAPLLDEVLSPVVNVVPEENVTALADRLREDGYMPRVEAARDEPTHTGRLRLAEREATPLLAAAYAMLHLAERRGSESQMKDLAALVARLERRLGSTARAQAERQAREWLGDRQ